MIRVLFVFFYTLLSCRATTFCSDPTQCWVGPEGCIESKSGVRCAECDFRGYTESNGTCVFESISILPYNTLSITPLCSNLKQCKNVLSQCVESKYGILCEECYFRGYINSEERCECYDTLSDSSKLCQPRITATSGYVIQENATRYSVFCRSHSNKALGFFENTTREFEIPSKCIHENIGPPPGTLVEDTVTGPFFTCNTFCSPDPRVPESTDCRTCAGAGTWDSTNYRCECDEGFSASFKGTTIAGDIYVCDKCYGFRSREPGSSFCQTITTPDPVDGKWKECGGHGIDTGGICTCYYNITAGYWKSAQISGSFKKTTGSGEIVDVSHTVNSCIECEHGFLLPSCIQFDSTVTLSPTTSSPTMLPSMSPTSSPFSPCIDGAKPFVTYENRIFDNLPTLMNHSLLVFPECSIIETRNVSVTNQVIASYSGNTSENHIIASLICRENTPCKYWSFQNYSDSTGISFSFYTNEEIIESSRLLGVSCGLIM